MVLLQQPVALGFPTKVALIVYPSMPGSKSRRNSLLRYAFSSILFTVMVAESAKLNLLIVCRLVRHLFEGYPLSGFPSPRIGHRSDGSY